MPPQERGSCATEVEQNQRSNQIQKKEEQNNKRQRKQNQQKAGNPPTKPESNRKKVKSKGSSVPGSKQTQGHHSSKGKPAEPETGNKKPEASRTNLLRKRSSSLPTQSNTPPGKCSKLYMQSFIR